MKGSNKVLFVNQFVPPWPGGSSKIMEGYFGVLQKNSFAVLSEKKETGPLWQASSVENSITWIPAGKPGALGNLNRIRQVKNGVSKLLRTGEFDRVWLVYPSPAFLVGGYQACKKFKIPYAVYMHDTWGEAVQHRSWPHRLLAFQYEKKIMKSAAKCFAISQGLSDHLGRVFGKPFSALPHPVEGELSFSPKEQWFPPAKDKPLKVAFTGGVYIMNNQALNLLVEGLKAWGKPFEFFLSTQAPEAELVELGVDLGTVKLCFFPTDKEYQNFLESMDVLVSCISFDSPLAAEERLTALPTKTFEYIRLGKPILVVAPKESVTACHARENGYAMVADSGGLDEIVAHFCRLYEEPSVINKMRKKQAELVDKQRPANLLERVAPDWGSLGSKTP